MIKAIKFPNPSRHPQSKMRSVSMEIEAAEMRIAQDKLMIDNLWRYRAELQSDAFWLERTTELKRMAAPKTNSNRYPASIAGWRCNNGLLILAALACCAVARLIRITKQKPSTMNQPETCPPTQTPELLAQDWLDAKAEENAARI